MSNAITVVASLLAFSLIARPLAAQGSNSCAGAQVISGSGPHAFDLNLATTGPEGQHNTGCHFSGSFFIQNDVWFQWTAPNTADYILTTCQQTIVDTKVAVYVGSTCPPPSGGAPLACDDDGCNSQALLRFSAFAQQTYLVQLGIGPFGAPGTRNFRILEVPSSMSDDCATPVPIFGTGLVAFDTTNATTGTESQDPACSTVQREVWYSWTAPADGLARLDTCGQTNMDTLIAAYPNACPVGGASALDCDDDACDLQSQIQWQVTFGTTFFFEIGSVSSGGFGTLRIEMVPLSPNDACATPVEINTMGGQFDTTATTTGSRGQGSSCGAIENDLWFKWTASVDGYATIETCGTTTMDTILAVYGGTGCPTSAAITCSDDACWWESQVAIVVTNGTTYTIQLGNAPGGSRGAGSINIIETPSGGNPMTPFCFPGQGGIITCPCNNPPTASGRGCNNFGIGPVDSALLTASGTPSINSDSLVLHASGENNTSTTIFLQFPSTSITGLIFGAGVRCGSGALKRLYTGAAAGGAISRPRESDPDVHTRAIALGDNLVAGSVRYYMSWYRDSQASGPCGLAVSTFNSSNSGRVIWRP